MSNDKASYGLMFRKECLACKCNKDIYDLVIAQAKLEERQMIEQELLIKGGIATKEQLKDVADKAKLDEGERILEELYQWLFHNAVFMEHLSKLQQKELFDKIEQLKGGKMAVCPKDGFMMSQDADGRYECELCGYEQGGSEMKRKDKEIGSR